MAEHKKSISMHSDLKLQKKAIEANQKTKDQETSSGQFMNNFKDVFLIRQNSG